MTANRKAAAGGYKKVKDLRSAKEWRSGVKGTKYTLVEKHGVMTVTAKGKKSMLRCNCGSKSFKTEKTVVSCFSCNKKV